MAAETWDIGCTVLVHEKPMVKGGQEQNDSRGSVGLSRNSRLYLTLCLLPLANRSITIFHLVCGLRLAIPLAHIDI